MTIFWFKEYFLHFLTWNMHCILLDSYYTYWSNYTLVDFFSDWINYKYVLDDLNKNPTCFFLISYHSSYYMYWLENFMSPHLFLTVILTLDANFIYYTGWSPLDFFLRSSSTYNWFNQKKNQPVLIIGPVRIICRNLGVSLKMVFKYGTPQILKTTGCLILKH